MYNEFLILHEFVRRFHQILQMSSFHFLGGNLQKTFVNNETSEKQITESDFLYKSQPFPKHAFNLFTVTLKICHRYSIFL